MKKKLLSLALCGAAIVAGVLPLSGCGTVRGENLMAQISPRPVTETPTGDEALAVSDFAVRLLQNCRPDQENTLLSPLSVLAALGMTTNGGAGETREQMEAVLGLPAEQLNVWIHSVMEDLPAEKTCAVQMANSIWMREDPALTVEQAFLQTNADYYGAAVYQAPFDDGTVEEINAWVQKHTDNLIDGILQEIPDAAMLYLVNALSLDAEWAEIYRETSVREDVFTAQSGQERRTEFLYSEEDVYLQAENAQGFLKYYKGGAYAFAALLPEEGTSLSDYVAGLTGARLLKALEDAREETVYAAIPKFRSEYTTELSEALTAMGMADAFDVRRADFSAMGSYGEDNLYISKILHKTKITVDERGTKAGAAAAVEMNAGEAPAEEPKVVHLNRPFVYLLVDCRTNTPVFLGTLLDTGA